MANNQVSKSKEQQSERQIAQQQRLKQVDEHEVEAKASAKAGLNLNLAAALSGIFTGWKSKKTDSEPDGSSRSKEQSHGRGHMTGHGVADLKAIGGGEATKIERQRHTVEGTQQQIDHLGLAERKSIEATSSERRTS